MDSASSRADTVRTAITSVSTCTPVTLAIVKELLQINEQDNDTSRPASRARPAKAPRAPSRIAQCNQGNGGSLSPRERAVLATQIITGSLKALGEAAKGTSSPSTQEPSKDDSVMPMPRKGMRRSNSAPMQPLQPRQLNRVTTSPPVQKVLRSPTSIATSTGCLATVECARAAFSALRALQASRAVQLPELQLESGMSSFVNRLIGLDLFDQAAKELRMLKRRLESMNNGDGAKKVSTRSGPETNTASKMLSELLDYPGITTSGSLLNLVISSQLQALRIIHGLKKSSHLESILPLLRESCSSSPINLLMMSLKDDNPDQTKCAKQLESLSQSLLSLTPGVSAKDDDFAVEPRLSPRPEVALEVQALGLTTRLQSWTVSGHRGDVDKDVLSPLSKCLAAFTRRASPKHFSLASSAFSQVLKRVEKLGLRPAESSRSPLAAIYQVLAGASRESGNNDEAKKWLAKLKSLTNPSEDSAAKCCSITAQLLALSLKQSSQIDDNLLSEVIDGLRGSVGGNGNELDDLLISVCLLRKSVMNLITAKKVDPTSVSQATSKLLEAFIFQLPRFTLRWLGKPPSSTKATKDFLRFEQRRELLSTYLPHILDSALMLSKLLLDEDKLAWDVMDSTLQDCLAILENMGDLARPGSKCNPSPSYHVKISHFYYQQHLVLRKYGSKSTETTSLKALRKSIDSVKNQSEAEQTRAQLLVKWERFAELCRASGRVEDAIDALRAIRDHLVREDIVPTITTSLATQPWLVAWQQNSNIELLSRTVCNLAKLDRKHNDWTWLLVGSDKATALEHDLYAIISKDSRYRQGLDLSNSTVKSLLEFYSVEQHPIRRLRTLLQLLTMNVGAQTGLDDLRKEVEAVLKAITEEVVGDDAGLIRYTPHLQALAACVFGLLDSNIDSPQVKKALSGWRDMISKCQSAEQLALHIDNPPQLLTNLQSLVDFARIKGLEALQTEILELSINLSKVAAENNLEVLITQGIALSRQHLSHGWSSKAEKLLRDNQELISQPEVARELAVNFHLSAAEYHLSLGALDKADQHLRDAQNAEMALSSEPASRKAKGSSRKVMIAYAYSLCSSLALERGDCHRALLFARIAVKRLFHDWSKLEEMRSASHETSPEDSTQSDASEKDTSMSNSSLVKADLTRANAGPEFWALVYPLFRFLLQLSSTYAHVGMYQETLYYAEQAQKVAKSMESAAYLSQSLTWLSWVWLTAGKPNKALELALEAKPIALGLEPTCQNAKVLCQLGSIYGETEDPEEQAELVGRAESMLKLLSVGSPSPSNAASELESRMTELDIKEKPAVKTTARRAATTKPTKTIARAPSRNASKKPASKTPEPPVEEPPRAKSEEMQLSFLRASVLQNQSIRLLNESNWTAAVSTLRNAHELSKLPADVSQACFLMGIALIGQSLEQMGHDAIFSVIQDSTLSFPSVAGPVQDKPPAAKAAAVARKGRGPALNARSFVDKLREAQGHLLAAHSIASLNGDGRLVHRIAIALQNVAILLSNTNPSRPAASHPAHATCTVELARNLTWRRERKALHLDMAREARLDWPIAVDDDAEAEGRRHSLGFSLDLDRFERDYVDVIPPAWNVVSVSLSEDERDLCITQLRPGAAGGPFGIRLPLERASSRDAGTPVFGFARGRAELREIVDAANRTSHDARDMSRKGARSAWWAEREALDERMRDLVEAVEEIWLGGFRGILAPPPRQRRRRARAAALARFRETFAAILDKYLPSRRQVRGRKTKAATTTTAQAPPPPPRVGLDERIYDLFVGLGDATQPGLYLDEPLTDLLYFVVDILQFHGERNAYDEIDFDHMVVDTFDALYAYHHEVARAPAAADDSDGEDGPESEDPPHTILVLDRALHAFPWESLPCLQGVAASRVPSLACLRRLILEARPPAAAAAARSGHHASANSGTYMLNPSGDLASTQATFGGALARGLGPGWRSVEGRAPAEEEFAAALAARDVLLYFGHGSGAQYVRGRTVRGLAKCRAAALLMGCSSASLADVGAFEPHGPARNYMLAGCPAVVGTLWDVTDRDIDRFTARVFEEWGLLPRGTFGEPDAAKRNKGKGKGKAKQADPDDEADEGAEPASRDTSRSKSRSRSRGPNQDRKRPPAGDAPPDDSASLVEAVSRARDACRFKYLTAAAVCVYGIPVFLDKSGQ
ncbi:peptidase family C50-domain-containing protein [Durotheca rogersii]|uniref:peptidase family C50-domain-containing protein n=1 Tax=Durotheca rogersii TaxID=419775 RepID=UPI002220028F|nr:peptidase family C50-domain-containing protein [Durotheca rogersii]KAI5868069.1 peptidase family C50-domain-containing protein [Durotheca rogersii]